MPSNGSPPWTDPRAYAIASAVGVAVGVALIGLGRAMLPTIGVVVIILGVVSFLLSVGLYFGSDEGQTAPGAG